MYGLRTWWVDAVGTTALRLHVSWVWMVVGALGGIVAAVVCIYFTLRRLGRASTRSLLAGAIQTEDFPRKGAKAQSKISGGRRSELGAFASLRGKILSLILNAYRHSRCCCGALQLIPRTAAFFGGGVILLIAGVSFISAWLKRKQRKANRRRRLVVHRAPGLSQRHLSPRSHRALHHLNRRRRIHHRRRRFIPPLRIRSHRSEVRHRRFPSARGIIAASGP